MICGLDQVCNDKNYSLPSLGNHQNFRSHCQWKECLMINSLFLLAAWKECWLSLSFSFCGLPSAWFSCGCSGVAGSLYHCFVSFAFVFGLSLSINILSIVKDSLFLFLFLSPWWHYVISVPNDLSSHRVCTTALSFEFLQSKGDWSALGA